jgi:hypothetical protein
VQICSDDSAVSVLYVVDVCVYRLDQPISVKSKIVRDMENAKQSMSDEEGKIATWPRPVGGYID